MVTLRRNKIGMVVCPNKDNFHNGVFVGYLIVDGVMVDDPTFQRYMKVINKNPNCKLEIILRTCRYCRARGCK